MLLPGATPTASLSIQKAASAGTVSPGDQFTYTIQFQCTAGTVSGCVNAELTDPMPAYLTVVGTPKVTGTANYDAGATTSSTLDVVFTDALGGGTVGLAPGKVVTVQVTVHVDDDAPASADGTVLTNTATITADNATSKSAVASSTLAVEPTIAAGASKSFTPSSGLNTTGATTEISVTGQNGSNVPVERLVISDPVLDGSGVPTTDINAFTYLTLDGITGVQAPAGADTVQLRVYDPTLPGWVAGDELPVPQSTLPIPDGVDPTVITGFQFIFRSTDGDDIPPGAGATVNGTAHLSEPIPEEELPFDISNTTETVVTTAGGRSARDADVAHYQVGSSVIDVSAGKSFDPAVVRAGENSTATLTAGNDSTGTIDSLTLVEPAPAGRGFFGADDFVFVQMGSADGGGIVWPDGASQATITYECAGTPADPQTTEDPNTLPDPPAGCDPVTGFSVTFTGQISPGAQATIPFVVQTPTDQTGEEALHLNAVRVVGQRGDDTGSAQAVAPIRTIIDRIDVEAGKRLYPSTIPSYPGQIVTAQLTGKLQEFPASTVSASTIVVQDPDVLPDPNQWYDDFDPQAVVGTPVPACASLTVQYTVDGTSWVSIPSMTGIAGAAIFNAVFPPSVQQNAIGIRFVYTAAPAGGECSGGFPPGTTVSPNLSFTLGADAPNETVGTLTDCTVTSAAAPTADDAESDPACDSVDLTPVTPGTIDPIDKSWSPETVVERSQAETTVALGWSTGGFTGTGRIDISDTASPATTAVADSSFDAFDLVSIAPITEAMDPWLRYDQILAVQLYLLPAGSTDPSAGSWVRASADPCPTACDGTFPGYTLTDDERERAIGFRLSYVESPNRADRVDGPTAPAVGSGVAASTGNDRHIDAVLLLRDLRRSDGQPVVASDEYNVPGEEGAVNNTVRLDPYWNVDDTEPILTRTDADDILITNVDVTVDGTKTWEGGPLGIPETGVDQSRYPTGRVTVTASNTTPAKLDLLSITEPDISDEGPSSCTEDPFEQFTLVGFASITAPDAIGADDVTIVLTPGPNGQTDYTRDEALALAEDDLVDVTSLTVAYTGRIDAATDTVVPTATIAFDVRLREQGRTSGDAPTPGTVCDQVKVEASDMVDFPDDTDTEDTYPTADIDLVAQGIDVLAGKTITPGSITEPSAGPVTVGLSGQPTGVGGTGSPASRAVELVLTDDSTTFFNQYDFGAFGPLSLTSPIDRVQVDALVGGTWSVGEAGPVLTGASWVNGTAGTSLALPTGVAGADVVGLRFTFTRADGANWENPANPVQNVSFQATRRDSLRTGGSVESDLAGSAPAPGEDDPGVATNLVVADVTSSDVDADGVPLSAQEDADDTVLYHHASNAVTVRKTPTDDTVSPGSPFTYTMTFVNSGDIDIVDPVITDIFQADADGPLIELAADPAYAFALSSGTGMPTDAADVTIDESATGLVFTFPAGSVLEVGDTYTISYQAVTRAGLPAGTEFTNTVGITGERPWDECDGGGEPGSGLDAGTGECRTVARDTVISAAAVGVSKLVRAQGSDELGVVIDPLVTTGADCAADADGFYARPCLPIAEPGGDITWRWHFVNAGNQPLDRILGIDRLPAPGDAVATAPSLERLSDWRPLLTGVRPVLASGSGTLNVYYTTGSDWCDGPAGADGQLLCPELDWVEWPAGIALPIDPASVTGLQTEYLPTGALAPAGTFDVDVAMAAPAYSPADTPNTSAMSSEDTYAFNSVGTSAREGGQAAADDIVVFAVGDYTLTTEPPRVGVGLAHGGLVVEKQVTGAAAGQYAPDTFEVTLSCVSAGVYVPLPADVAALTLEAGTPVTIYDLPYGAVCTLGEGDNGQTTSQTTSATVQREVADFETATLVNDYEYASLSVTKTVDSDAVDQDGGPVEYGPFTVSVECFFLGDAVYATGYGPDDPMTADLSDGEVVTFDGLPAGAECTVEETDDKGAATTTIVTTVGDDDAVTTDGTVSDPIELAPDDDGAANSAEVINAFEVGRLPIVKIVDGDVADLYGAGPFTVHVRCVLSDDTGIREVFDDDVVLGGGAPLSAVIVDLAAGAQCLVTEPADGGASTSTVSPTGPIPVDPDEPVQVTVTNTFDPAVLYVDKVVDGDAAGFAPDTFPIEVICIADGELLPGFPLTVEVTPGTPVEIDTLAGAGCAAIETDTGAATEVVYDPPSPSGASSDAVLVDPDDPPTITVTNTYRAGGLQIVKRITGSGATAATGPFVFSVVCAFDGDPAAFSESVTLRPAGSLTISSDVIEPLPVGAECTVAETDDGGADQTPPPVTVIIPDPDDEPAVVRAQFENEFTADLAGTGGVPAWWLLSLAGGVLMLGLALGLGAAVRRRSGRVEG
ncbi:hypothetical protein GCM10025738_16160 [Microbacterium fluvii]